MMSILEKQPVSVIKKSTSASDYIRAAYAVLLKDIKCELRAKHALGAILLFAVTSTIAVSFTLGSWGRNSAVASALLWLVIYFSAMSGLSRSFVREEEAYTASILKLAARPNCIYLGKLAFNFGMLLVLEIVTVPLFILLMNVSVANWGVFIFVLVVGSLGISSGATMAAAMVARARAKGTLFAVISFPLLIPVLAIAIHATNITMASNTQASALSDIRLLIYYFGVVITASLMLFRYVWED